MANPDSNITRVPVAVQSDFMRKQASATPLQALAECIWNSLDADATKVDVEIVRNVLGIQSITIRDNGTGMTREKAPELFSKLGDSWKRQRGRTDSGREMHGSEGRGRYKVTVLGRVSDWRVTYKDDDGSFKRFAITVILDDLREVQFTNAVPVDAIHSGVELVITEALSDFRSLQSESTPQQLTEIFATHLRRYKDLTVSLQGVKLDPAAVMVSEPAEMNLSDIEEGGKRYPARLEIVEWKRKTERVLYLCDDRGFPMLSVDTRWHVGERFFSAYLRSALIRDMSDRNEIGIGEMNPSLAHAVAEARARIKDFFRAKQAEEAQTVVDEWKTEKVYPFPEPPVTSVEKVTREVFDIMATTAVRFLPDFSTTNSTSRAFQLRMMRTAIENGSEDLQLIMKEVLKLPARLHEELAHLIQDSSLPAIINASRVVSNRLKFLTGLNALVFDRQIGSTMRERTQLHRILADNTWLFGEEHHLMVDDRSLDECLKQHTGARNIMVPKGAVLHPSKSRGIVDLMFGKQRAGHRPEDLEHLVVELKAPKVAIGRDEIGQIEGYVGAITNDSRFDTTNTKWYFWVLSCHVDDKVMRLRQIPHAEPGMIIKQDNIVIIVRTWAQVINESRARMKFFEDNLDMTVTKADALRHLRERYATLFKDTAAGAALDETIRGEDELENRAGA